MPNYPPQLQDMQDDVLNRLAETNVSPTGAFAPGDGSGDLISTKATITQYLNEGSADLARTCYPVADHGVLSVTAGTQIIPYTSFVCASGHTIWSARRVVCGGAELEYYTREAFEFWYPTSETDARGAPTIWYRQGHDGIGLYPVPDATMSTTVYGLVTPKPLVNNTDVATWFQPDVLKLPVYYATWQIAGRNVQNPDMAVRIQEWATNYTQGQQDFLTRLWQTQPQLARFHYGQPKGGGS